MSCENCNAINCLQNPDTSLYSCLNSSSLFFSPNGSNCSAAMNYMGVIALEIAPLQYNNITLTITSSPSNSTETNGIIYFTNETNSTDNFIFSIPSGYDTGLTGNYLDFTGELASNYSYLNTCITSSGSVCSNTTPVNDSYYKYIYFQTGDGEYHNVPYYWACLNQPSTAAIGPSNTVQSTSTTTTLSSRNINLESTSDENGIKLMSRNIEFDTTELKTTVFTPISSMNKYSSYNSLKIENKEIDNLTLSANQVYHLRKVKFLHGSYITCYSPTIIEESEIQGDVTFDIQPSGCIIFQNPDQYKFNLISSPDPNINLILNGNAIFNGEMKMTSVRKIGKYASSILNFNLLGPFSGRGNFSNFNLQEKDTNILIPFSFNQTISEEEVNSGTLIYPTTNRFFLTKI